MIYLNIGSNLGDRRLNISRAIQYLEKEFGFFELSHAIETDPVGYESEKKFLNIGMVVYSNLPPQEILTKTQEIEKKISDTPHRNHKGSYIDRIIDIDIIAVDEIKIDSEELTLPHPKLQERRFVLEPMQELIPFWRHPDTGLTPSEMLGDLT